MSTIAARVQSRIGNVAAGSIFAVLQIAAMGEYGAVVAANLVRLGGILAGAEAL